MIWGTHVAPEALQELMESVVEILKSQFSKDKLVVSVHIYLDDLLITGKKHSHVAAAGILLRSFFKKANFCVSEKKSSSVPQQTIQWLGATLKPGSISIPGDKTEDLKIAYHRVLSERNLKSILTFLGKAAS